MESISLLPTALFILFLYFLGWVFLVFAVIYLVTGLRNQAQTTFTIGGGFLIGSVLCFYFTSHSFLDRFDEKPLPERVAYADTTGKPTALLNEPKDTAMIRVSIGEFYFGVRVEGAKTGQNNDTVFIDATDVFPNEDSFEFTSGTLHDLSIDQASDHVIGISWDGPHCDLENWNNYVGPWEVLHKDENGKFFPTLYLETHYSTPLKIDVEELKSYALKHCGEQYREAINSIKQVGESPGFIAINHVYLRLKGVDSEGKQHIKYICFRLAFGC